MKRKCFCFAVAALLSLWMGVTAQNTLIVCQKDGQMFAYGFKEKPVVTFSESHLIITTTETEIQYPLAAVDKFLFDERIPDALGSMKEGVRRAIASLSHDVLCIVGAKADIPVSLVSMDGKVLRTARTDDEGRLVLDVKGIAEGVYILKSESLTCKILKK